MHALESRTTGSTADKLFLHENLGEKKSWSRWGQISLSTLDTELFIFMTIIIITRAVVSCSPIATLVALDSVH